MISAVIIGVAQLHIYATFLFVIFLCFGVSLNSVAECVMLVR